MNQAHMELEITWNRALRVWWSFFWLLLVALAVAFILSIGVGMSFGHLTVALDLPPHIMMPLGRFIGWCMGMLTTVVPIRLILGKRFRRFRLVLISTEAAPPETVAHGA